MTLQANQSINQLSKSFEAVLVSIYEGTINKQQLTDILNDHVDRIVNLENRLQLLQEQIDAKADTMPGGIDESGQHRRWGFPSESSCKIASFSQI